MTPLAKRRKDSGHQQPMFLRMIWRAALVRRGRALTALLAVAVAAAVTTTLLNLYVDAQAKLQTEFRNYGANIVVVAPEGTSLPADALSKVETVIGTRGMAVPVADAVAKAGSMPVVIVGTNLRQAMQMNRWWKVDCSGCFDSTPLTETGTLIGEAAKNRGRGLIGSRFLTTMKQTSDSASAMKGPSHTIWNLQFGDRTFVVEQAGVIQTGAAEDSRIYLDLPDFTKFTGVRPSTIEIAVSGSTDEINATMDQLKQALN